MCEGYCSHSVTRLTATYLVCESKMRFCMVPHAVQHFKRMYCVDFAENALFSRFGVSEDDRLKILEAQLASKTHNVEEKVWERLQHVLMVRGDAIHHQMHHIHEDVNVFFMALMSIRSCCPFVHKYDYPVVKLINQILNLDHKYVIATFFCLAVGFLIIVYFWLTT